MGDGPVQFSRAPYKVQYVDLSGAVKTIRRVPPPKLHDALPTDVVEITRKKNDDFASGDDVEVVGISSRQPNVLQVRNEAGQTTFLDYFETRLEEIRAYPAEDDPSSTNLPKEWYRNRPPPDSRYLIWP